MHGLGSLLYFELKRLARSGRLHWFRVAVPLALSLFAFVYFAANASPGYPGDWAPSIGPEMNYQLTRTYVAWQYLAVFVLTPLLVAPAVRSERDTGRLDLLFVSGLSRGVALSGMLLTRLALMVVILLASLPVLSLFVSLGGISPLWLARSYLDLLLLAVLLSLISLKAGLDYSSRLRNANAQTLIAAYVFSFCWVSLVTVLSRLVLPSVVLSYYVTPDDYVQIGLVLVILWQVVGLARRIERLQHGDEYRSRFGGAVTPVPRRRETLSPNTLRPPVSRHPPLLWWEWKDDRSCLTVGAVLLVVVLSTMVIVGSTISADQASFLPLNFIAFAWFAGAAWRASGSISRERECGRIEIFLTLPFRASEWVTTKAFAAAVSPVMVPWIFLWAVSMIFYVPSKFISALLPVVMLAHGALLVSVGLWLSSLCRTMLVSRLWMAVTLFVLPFGLFMLRGERHLLRWMAQRDWQSLLYTVGLNPALCWTVLENEPARIMEAQGSELLIAVSLAGAGIYSALALIFFRLACRNVRREFE